jgi:hypothetical protein
MILTIFLIGLLSTIVGALPTGTSNLTVIKTTVQENIYQSLKISYGAGIGVFLGKVTTLYGYGKLGTRIQKKKPNANATSLNRMIGVVLISLSLLQTTKLLLF